MLKEAKRLGYIHTNPAEEIRRLSEKPKVRSILRIDEVKELLLDDNIDRVWDGDLFNYTLNLIAASTGIRMGEIQALMVQNVHEGYISIFYSWDRKYGLKEPKWGSKREIPIPSKSSQRLQELIACSPYNEPQDFVFWGESRNKPVSNKMILNTLYKAFENIGISPEER